MAKREISGQGVKSFLKRNRQAGFWIQYQKDQMGQLMLQALQVTPSLPKGIYKIR